MHWVKIMKALKQRINVAKENLRAAEMKLKNRRLQAMVPKASVKNLKNKVAALGIEYDNAIVAIRKCTDALCPSGWSCNNTNGSCKKVECKPEQEWKDGKCADRCNPEQEWKDGKCSDRCNPEQEWKDGKCADRCKPDTIFKGGICVKRCRPLQIFKNGKCSDLCAKDESWENGKCIQICKSGEKQFGDACVKVCKTGEELKQGKCVKPDPSCRNKRQCVLHWKKIMKALKQRINVAKENLRAAEMKLKNRRLQAVEPKAVESKASLRDLKNKVVSLQVEYDNALVAIKKCADALCPIGYACNKDVGTCKKVECAKDERLNQATGKCVKICPAFQTWSGEKCEDKCKTPGTQWKDGKCINLCQTDEAWGNGKCNVRCPKEDEKWDGKACIKRCGARETWKYNKCIDRCAYGKKWNQKTEKCDSICKESEYYLKDKCVSKCQADSKWSAEAKKCVKICKEGTTLTEGKCVENCEEFETWKNGICVGNCKDGNKWDAFKKTCVSDCTKDQISLNGKCQKICPDGSLLDKDNHCVTAIKLYAPLQNFWRQNREREDKELMMAEFKRTAL
jgi:F0F1-type ATP synthase membrane subunit b/b'